jgi:hypothetical protein
MTSFRLGLALLFVLLTACVNQPETYAPPMQRRPLAGPDTSKLKHFVAMNDPAAMEHVLRDVNPALEGQLFRWTGQKPTFQFFLPAIQHLNFVMHFSIHSDTIKQTGPLTVSYFVNGRPLGKVTYDKPGEQHFEKPVDSSWLLKNSVNVASAELDKIYVAPEDGAQLGLTLIRVGFRE